MVMYGKMKRTKQEDSIIGNGVRKNTEVPAEGVTVELVERLEDGSE